MDATGKLTQTQRLAQVVAPYPGRDNLFLGTFSSFPFVFLKVVSAFLFFFWGMIKIKNTLAGKAAKLTAIGVCLEENYSTQFDIGNVSTAKQTLDFCQAGMILVAENESPIQIAGIELHCFREAGIGIGKHGDLHWFSLDQVEFLT